MFGPNLYRHFLFVNNDRSSINSSRMLHPEDLCLAHQEIESNQGGTAVDQSSSSQCDTGSNNNTDNDDNMNDEE